MKAICVLLVSAYTVMAAGAPAAPEAKPPAQAARGQAAFFDENVAAHCGGCHSLAHLNARAIVMAIRATRTQYVQWIKLKNGKEFPGMPAAKDEGTTVQYYDLSATPPALKKLEKSEIASVGDNASWKHPPESAGYTAQQLADVIAYIKWASYGDTKGVNPADTE